MSPPPGRLPLEHQHHAAPTQKAVEVRVLLNLPTQRERIAIESAMQVRPFGRGGGAAALARDREVDAGNLAIG